MTQNVVMLPGSSDLDALQDPAKRIILACERAKTWLLQALEGDDFEQIMELKSQAAAIKVYTMQKQLGKDAELSAVEIVRRAERCIGLAVRKGQAAGRIRKSGERAGSNTTRSPTPYVGMAQERQDTYAMTDGVSSAEFDKALSKAKAEQNLSRANIVRKLKGKANGKADRWVALADLAAAGNTSSQIAKKLGVACETVVKVAKKRGVVIVADRVLGKLHHLNQNRILKEFVGTLESLVPSCEMIYPSKVSKDVLSNSIIIMDEAMPAFSKLRRRLKRGRD